MIKQCPCGCTNLIKGGLGLAGWVRDVCSRCGFEMYWHDALPHTWEMEPHRKAWYEKLSVVFPKDKI